jgi:hypothetical protein
VVPGFSGASISGMFKRRLITFLQVPTMFGNGKKMLADYYKDGFLDS